MHWTRTDTLALALLRCVCCHGMGLRATRGGRMAPCNCVLRAIFRACYNRFRECVEKEKNLTRVSLDVSARTCRRVTWSRKTEEYIVDFQLVSRRALTPEEYRIFNYHFLLGADWKLCTRKLKMDRGAFFHQVYQIEQKLGRVYRELEPYALFPLDEYFHGASRYGEAAAGPRPVPVVPAREPFSSRIPLRKVA